MNVPTEAISPYDVAERLLGSDLIARNTRLAVIDAIQQTHGHGIGHPSIDAIRTAAMIFRAPLRCVAAALGYLQCIHSGTWIDLRANQPAEDDVTGCPRVGDAESLPVYAALLLWQTVGGPVTIPHTRPTYVAHPERVSERLKRLTDGSGGDRLSSESHNPC